VAAAAAAVSPYAPAVIRELLSEVIATGHGLQVRHNIARHFFTSAPHQQHQHQHHQQQPIAAAAAASPPVTDTDG